MNIRVKANHVEITSALKEYAEKKLSKVDKFFDNIQSVVIELLVAENSDANLRQVVRTTVYASGSIIRAEAASKDMYASIDTVFDKLGVQLKKHHDRLRDHKHRDGGKRLFTSVLHADAEVSNGKELSQDQLYVPEPLEAEEAVRLLKERHTPFLVFRNFQTEAINVIYPMGDNEFGIIEP